MTRQLWYPRATRQELENDRGGPLSSIGLVLHVQAGNNNPYGWFDRPEVKGSSHWWLPKKGGVVQYVPANLMAWAQGAGNGIYHSVETEGWPTEDLTPEQVAELGELYRWGHDEWGWPYRLAEKPGQRGFGWHGMGSKAWGGHDACPGEKRKARRRQVLELASKSLVAAGGKHFRTEEEDDVPDEYVAACLAPSGKGWWKLKRDGSVETFGFDVNAHKDANLRPLFHGSMFDTDLVKETRIPGRYFIDIQAAGTRDEDGYVIFSSDNGAFKRKRG